tara:strand:- start:5211 stop:5936 length:726 start_codon:yes stop_codon:yes gene_type:complete
VTILTSCGSKKDVIYFQDVKTYETIVGRETPSNTFKVDDVIEITVSTLNPDASIPFNILKGAQEGGLRAEQLNYIVDKSGNIDFPVLGKIKLLGLTVEEAKELITSKLSGYLKDPIINIRLKNFTVTVLGEVHRPGAYPVIGEQITILDALGLAGDLTIKGKRNNIMVIREFEGTTIYNRIDLTKKEAFNSPVFYLTQNDVVYVEPNKSAISSSGLDSRTNVAISIASLVITSTILLITRN